MREIKKIIVHCSDSEWGSFDEINKWHKEKGWAGKLSNISCGYHYVINSSYPDYSNFKYNRPNMSKDGLLETGRPEEEIGAHAEGNNSDSIGICLIGKEVFSSMQLVTLQSILKKLMSRYNLNSEDIFGHRDFSTKTCPNIDTEWIRELVKH